MLAGTSHTGLLQLKFFSFSDGTSLSCSSLSRYFLALGPLPFSILNYLLELNIGELERQAE